MRRVFCARDLSIQVGHSRKRDRRPEAPPPSCTSVGGSREGTLEAPPVTSARCCEPGAPRRTWRNGLRGDQAAGKQRRHGTAEEGCGDLAQGQERLLAL